MRKDVAIIDPGPRRALLVDPPAGYEDTLRIAAAKGSRIQIKSVFSQTVVDGYDADPPSAVLIFQNFESPERSIRRLFQTVENVRQAFPAARLTILLFPRDEVHCKSLERLGAQVVLWQRAQVELAVSLIKNLANDLFAQAPITFEFCEKGRTKVSTPEGNFIGMLGGGCVRAILQKFLEREGVIPHNELTHAAGGNELHVKSYISRLKKYFKRLPLSLGVKFKICNAGYKKGYYLIIKKIKPPKGGSRE